MGVYAAVIGGGAAGMLCAVRAAENHPDKKIVIVEKADRVGKKLLVTGNGRCNLSHIGASAQSYHGEGCEEVVNILFQKYNSEAVLAYFGSIGLRTAADSEGRVYPLSNQASSVLDVLRLRLRDLRVDELCGTEIQSVRQCENAYEIIADGLCITAQKLVVATGGKADYAGRESGSVALIRSLGLSTTKPSPSLSPVKVRSDVIRMLKGIRATAAVRLVKDGQIIREERGEVQFADGALSGICIFNLSRCANMTDACRIDISLLPDMTLTDIKEELNRRIAARRSGTLAELFIGLFHKNIGAALIKQAGLSPTAICGDMSVEDIDRLATVIDRWSFVTEPRYDFQNAQVTAGGVKLCEIDPHTFQCRKHRGLYIIGEALDIDGDCGGYNLQFAFASGMCAGDSL